jgi:hypothetical protein
MLSVVVDDTTLSDITDSQGRYTLSIPLHDEVTRTVDVNAYREDYIEADSVDIEVTFGEIRILDFLLEEQAQIIWGAIHDSVFYTGIESVYVDVYDDMGDPVKSVCTNISGRYAVGGLRAGTYDISFTHDDFLPEYHTVTLENPPPLLYPLFDTLEQVIWHVETTGNDDTGDGRWTNPFATIQKGIDSTNTGDTVLVGPGTYGTEASEGISFLGKQIVVLADSMANPELTVVDCNDQGRGFVFENGESSLSVLRGFTIKNGHTAGSGGAILCRGGSPTVYDCIVESNYASDRGGGIAVQTETTSPILRHCVIKNNSARERGGGVYCFEYCNPTIENCTVVANSADSTNGRGGGISSIMCDATITKCIIWGNSDYHADESTDQIDTATSIPIVEYSDVQGDDVWSGEGNMNDHPLFCNLNEDNFYLAINSPCNNYPNPDEYIGALGVGCDTLGIISGTVVNSDTRIPIEAVEVVASDFDGISETRTDLTDINGDYELPLPIIHNVTNTADVTFSHPAYIDITVEDTVYIAGDSTTLDTALVSGCEYIPGDVDNNGIALEIADVSAMICYYRGACPPDLECYCQDAGVIFVTADPDGSCIPLELSDVLQEICAYRGTCLAYGCSDCPGAGPPPPGACCFGQDCEFTSTRQECWDQGGEWHYFRTCPEFDCSTVPAPPGGASAVPSLKSKVKIDRGRLTQ